MRRVQTSECRLTDDMLLRFVDGAYKKFLALLEEVYTDFVLKLFEPPEVSILYKVYSLKKKIAQKTAPKRCAVFIRRTPMSTSGSLQRKL